MDMKNSTDTLRNMYDVIKILFTDWSMKHFIIMHGMEHFNGAFKHYYTGSWKDFYILQIYMMSSKYRFLIIHADFHCKVFRD